MTTPEFAAFIDWRDPKFAGSFSFIDAKGRHMTWLTRSGIILANSIYVPTLLRMEVAA
jgi:hypothetical protein